MSPQVICKNLQETALLKLTLELKVTCSAPKNRSRGEEMRKICEEGDVITHALRHTHTHTFWALELRVAVYPRIADVAVSEVEDICKFTSFERAWHSSNEDSLLWINGLDVVHDIITI